MCQHRKTRKPDDWKLWKNTRIFILDFRILFFVFENIYVPTQENKKAGWLEIVKKYEDIYFGFPNSTFCVRKQMCQHRKTWKPDDWKLWNHYSGYILWISELCQHRKTETPDDCTHVKTKIKNRSTERPNNLYNSIFLEIFLGNKHVSRQTEKQQTADLTWCCKNKNHLKTMEQVLKQHFAKPTHYSFWKDSKSKGYKQLI